MEKENTNLANLKVANIKKEEKVHSEEPKNE